MNRKLRELSQSERPEGNAHGKCRRYRWEIWDGGETVANGAVWATSTETAMVAVRDAALADGLKRPFHIQVARVFKIDDKIVQTTAEEV